MAHTQGVGNAVPPPVVEPALPVGAVKPQVVVLRPKAIWATPDTLLKGQLLPQILERPRLIAAQIHRRQRVAILGNTNHVFPKKQPSYPKVRRDSERLLIPSDFWFFLP